LWGSKDDLRKAGFDERQEGIEGGVDELIRAWYIYQSVMPRWRAGMNPRAEHNRAEPTQGRVRSTPFFFYYFYRFFAPLTKRKYKNGPT